MQNTTRFCADLPGHQPCPSPYSPKQAGLDKLRAAIQGNRGFIFATCFSLFDARSRCQHHVSAVLLCLHHEELHFGRHPRMPRKAHAPVSCQSWAVAWT